VAVKLIHTSLAAEPAFRTRFRREADAARRVGGFHTAQVVDADPEADPPWIVTAYIPGPSLRDAVHEHGPLPPASVLTLGGGIAEGLSAVHACGLVHRDLKPGNVIVAADGPRIIDFGIVHAVDASTVTASGAVVGTPAYMSPEQARGDDVLGAASDVFSFGAVLAFAASGRSPFAAGSIAVAIYRILHEEPDLTAVPLPVRDLVAGCLAKTPQDRPSLAELIERLAPETGDEHWLPSAVAAMVTEHSASLPDAMSPDAVSLAQSPVTAPDPTPPIPAPRPVTAPSQNSAAPSRNSIVATARDPVPVTAPAPPNVPEPTSERVPVTVPSTRKAVSQGPGDSPSTVPSPPSSASPEDAGGGRPGRRWVWPVASAAAALITVTGVVVATSLTGTNPQPPRGAPVAPVTVSQTAASSPTASPRPSRTRRQAPSTAPEPTSFIPAGYSLRKVFDGRVAVPSRYTNRPINAGCTSFHRPPGQLEQRISVCKGEGTMVPKGAAARADFWKNWFEDPERRPLRPVTISDVKVNGRPAKQLTVYLDKGEVRPFLQQEVYYSGPEGDWKIVVVTEVKNTTDKVDDSLVRTAIRTFRP
jgi:serine/threonine protein kinase